MSAAELRKAAETLRERAQSFPCTTVETSGAWDSGHAVRRPNGTWFHFAPTTYERAQRADFQAASAYFATFSPALGFAFAEWLDAAAEHVASFDCEAHCEYPDGCGTARAALAVARLINGGGSDD